MVKRTVIGKSGEEKVVDLLKEIQRRASEANTSPTGDKVLGENEDFYWTRPDGSGHSMREIDLELEDATARIEDAEDSLAQTGARLDDAEQAVQNAINSLDGKLDEADLDDPATSQRLADSMTDVTRGLIVTDWAILNHATLIGQTVVDDINVQGKLIGTDGVFTGTVDFENINITGEVLANKISGEHLYGTTVEGGEFTGGLFKTSNDLPGQVVLSDTAFHDPLRDVHLPGVGIAPLNQSDMAIPPGIGAADRGLIVSGGTDTTGARGMITASPTEVRTSWYRSGDGAHFSASDGGINIQSYQGGVSNSTVSAQPTIVSVRAKSGSGSSALSGRVQATTTSASADYSEGNQITASISVSSRQALQRVRLADGQQKAFRIDDTGIWVDTERDGTSKSYNLEETAQDSGWINLSFASGFQNNTGGADFQYRLMGNMVHLRGRIQRTSGDMVAGTSYTIGTLSSALRPSATQRVILAGGPSTEWGRLEISSGSGVMTVAPMSGNVGWIDLTGTYWTRD